MTSYDLFGYQVEIDKTATRAWYDTADEWGCECGHCRNFLELARSRMLPGPIVALLDSVDIPHEKATYVCELYTDNDGVHYQFSYRIAGVIRSEPRTEAGLRVDSGRCCHETYPYGAPDFPEPHFDLEFYATLPWVLDEPED